jgi:hypothetical protein
MDLAERIALELGEDETTWRQRLKLALFSVVFGSVPHHLEVANYTAVAIMVG